MESLQILPVPDPFVLETSEDFPPNKWRPCHLECQQSQAKIERGMGPCTEEVKVIGKEEQPELFLRHQTEDKVAQPSAQACPPVAG